RAVLEAADDAAMRRQRLRGAAAAGNRAARRVGGFRDLQVVGAAGPLGEGAAGRFLCLCAEAGEAEASQCHRSGKIHAAVSSGPDRWRNASATIVVETRSEVGRDVFRTGSRVSRRTAD